MIYFIQRPDGGPIKIGKSIQPSVRRKAVEKKRGCVLRCLGVMPGGIPEEGALHRRFSALRLEREWFRPESELTDFIATNASPWTDDRNESPVRLDRTLTSRAKAIAAYRGVPVAEILSELVRGPLDKAYAQMLREMEKEGKE